jgi:hypothetical protein
MSILSSAIGAGALQEKFYDLPGGMPIQRALRHQQPHHHMTVELSIKAHRQFVH